MWCCKNLVLLLVEMWQSRQAAAYRDKPLEISEKKSGRKYRNLPGVFVVADDDEVEEGAELENESSNPRVNISLYPTSPDITHSFPCTEITSSGHTSSR